jgi:hypothetical protein
MMTYTEAIEGVLENSHKFILSNDEIVQINAWVIRFVQIKKIQEGFYKNRSISNLAVSYQNGYQAEVCVEKLLKIKFIDWGILKKNIQVSEHNFSDLKNIDLDIGIKSSVFGLPALVSINPTTPEIICVRLTDKGITTIYICGYASVDCLKKYSNKNISHPADCIGKKMSFFGYKFLQPFESIKDLEELLKNAS